MSHFDDNPFPSFAIAASYYSLFYAVFYAIITVIISFKVSFEIYAQRKRDNKQQQLSADVKNNENAESGDIVSPKCIQPQNINLNLQVSLELTKHQPSSDNNDTQPKQEMLKIQSFEQDTEHEDDDEDEDEDDEEEEHKYNNQTYLHPQMRRESASKTISVTHSLSARIIPLNQIRSMRIEKTVNDNINIDINNNNEKKASQAKVEQVILDTNILKIWCSILYKKYSIYLSLFAHILDSTSSISVLILWIYSSILDSNSDLLLMGISLLFIFILYRIISSIYIYNVTQQYLDVFLQIVFDLKLYLTAYNSHSRNHPSIPMRWLRRMQIILQSAPNSIFCFVFLIRNSYNNSHKHYVYVISIVVLSLMTSLYSIIIRLVADDSFNVSLYANNYRNYGYYQRLAFRTFELSLRILTLTLIWICCGGIIFTIFVTIEIIIILIISCKDKTNKDLFFNYFIIINLSQFAAKSKKTLIKRVAIRQIIGFIFLMIILSFSSSPFECSKHLTDIVVYENENLFANPLTIAISFCIDYEYRKQVFVIGYALPIAAFFMWLTLPLLFVIIYPYITSYKKYNDYNTRSLIDIVKYENDSEIETLLDWIEFGANTEIINCKNANYKSWDDDDTKYYNCMMIAAKKGKLQHLMVLIASGSDINAFEQIEHKTALHIATINNQYKIVALLLKAGINAHQMDVYRKTAMHYASLYGNVKLIKKLLQNGANLFQKDKENKTPMMIAKENNNVKVLQFLEKYNKQFHHNGKYRAKQKEEKEQ